MEQEDAARPPERLWGTTRPRTHRTKPPPPRCAASCDPPLPPAPRHAPRRATIEMTVLERPPAQQHNINTHHHRVARARRAEEKRKGLPGCRHVCCGQVVRRPHPAPGVAILRSGSAARRCCGVRTCPAASWYRPQPPGRPLLRAGTSPSLDCWRMPLIACGAVSRCRALGRGLAVAVVPTSRAARKLLCCFYQEGTRVVTGWKAKTKSSFRGSRHKDVEL